MALALALAMNIALLIGLVRAAEALATSVAPPALTTDRFTSHATEADRPASFGHEAASAKASACNTATSWAEQTAPGVWRGVCGDDWGHELLGNSPLAFAELHWAMASAAGADSDAAFEDAYHERAGEERVGRYSIEPRCRVGAEDSPTDHCALEPSARYDYESSLGGWIEVSPDKRHANGHQPPTGAELRCYDLQDEDAMNACLRAVNPTCVGQATTLEDRKACHQATSCAAELQHARAGYEVSDTCADHFKAAR